MVTQELINFIQAELQKGKTPDSIIPSLTSTGWQSQDIQTAFSQLGVTVSLSSSPSSLPKVFKLSTPLLIGLVVLFLGVSAVLGFWGYKSIFTENTKKETIIKESLPSFTPSPKVVDINTPSAVVDAFLNKLKLNDKNSAKIFISENASGDAFKSILDSQYKGSSIYSKNFTFKIDSSNINSNSVTAQTQAQIIVDGQSLQVQVFLGKENGRWKLLDLWVSTPQDKITSNFIDLLKGEAGDLKRSVIRLTGSADFSFSSPTFGSIGAGVSNTTPRELGALYIGSVDPKILSITDLYGIWIMKVTSTSSGKFTIETEIVDRDNHQIKTFTYAINNGEVKYFSVSYPWQKGFPISVLPLN